MFETAANHVRYLAWLVTVPDKQKISRAKAFLGGDSINITPDPICAWLVQLAMECGLVRSTGFGIEPVSWQEVAAWAGATFTRNAWTIMSVHRLSEIYVEFLHKAKDPACPMPVEMDVDQQREMVSKQLQRLKRARNTGAA